MRAQPGDGPEVSTVVPGLQKAESAVGDLQDIVVVENPHARDHPQIETFPKDRSSS